MTEAGKSPVRFLIWLPLGLYGLAVSACLASVGRGGEPVYALEILTQRGDSCPLEPLPSTRFREIRQAIPP